MRNKDIDKAKLHHLKDFTSLLAVPTNWLGPVSLYLFPLLSYKKAWLNKKRASHCSFVLKIIPGPEHWCHLTNKEPFLTVTNIANKWHGWCAWKLSLCIMLFCNFSYVGEMFLSVRRTLDRKNVHIYIISLTFLLGKDFIRGLFLVLRIIPRKLEVRNLNTL